MKKKSLFIKNQFLLIGFFLFSFNAYPQLSNPNLFVCKNAEITYSYASPISGSCSITWGVSGGVLPDHNNQTSVIVNPAPATSTMKVKWTGGVSNPFIRVTSSCISTDQRNVTINEFPLIISSNPSSVNLGDQVTLSASTNPGGTYSWASTSGGNLNSTSGNPVIASPVNQSVTYSTTTSRSFQLNSNPPINCTLTASKVVTVNLPPLAGNSICCNQCIPIGTVPSPLTGPSVTGGNGSAFSYFWQQSTNGSSFSTIGGSASESYSPGALSQKTWYRRAVSGGGLSAPAVSNYIIVDVLNLPISPTVYTTNYPSNAENKAFGTITIQGNQVPSAGVSVNFIAHDKISVTPSTSLKPGVVLSIGALCDPPLVGGRTASVQIDSLIEELPINSIIEIAQNDTLKLETKSNELFFNAYPNPVKEEVTFEYQVGEQVSKILIIDEMGRVIDTVIDNNIRNGVHQVVFKCEGLMRGVYTCRLITKKFIKSKKLIVVK